MNIVVERNELFAKLSHIRPVARKSGDGITSGILFAAEPSGVKIVAAGPEAIASQGLKAQVIDAGAACIPAKELHEIVKDLDGEISFTLQSTAKSEPVVVVKSGTSRFRIKVPAAEEFPSMPEIQPVLTFTVEAGALIRGLHATSYAIARNGSDKVVMRGILAETRGNGEVRLVATDGHRMAVDSVTVMPSSETEQPVRAVLPGHAADEIAKMFSSVPPGDSINIVVGTNHMSLSAPGAYFAVSLVDGAYPAYQSILDRISGGSPTTAVVARAALLASLRRAAVMVEDGASRFLNLTFGPDEVDLSSANGELGEARDAILSGDEYSYAGSPVTLKMDAKYLLDAVSNVTGEKVSFDIKDNLSPVKIAGAGEYAWPISVIMPIR